MSNCNHTPAEGRTATGCFACVDAWRTALRAAALRLVEARDAHAVSAMAHAHTAGQVAAARAEVQRLKLTEPVT